MRFGAVELWAPKLRGKLPNVRLWAVWARETGTPAGVQPVEWRLLTTLPVESFAQACEKLEWHTRRWGIEVFHRTAKSGCKIETRQLGHAVRIEARLAIDLVVALLLWQKATPGFDLAPTACHPIENGGDPRGAAAAAGRQAAAGFAASACAARICRNPDWMKLITATHPTKPTAMNFMYIGHSNGASQVACMATASANTRRKRESYSIDHSNFRSPRTRHKAAPVSEHQTTWPPQRHNMPRSVMLSSISEMPFSMPSLKA
jgi:hypothetical protein